ncbi:hypothetical protein PtrM4_122020 [Pyrenophora tritici-repentis]|uniref:Lipoprotein n=1 Tax=Pyrenophora tritici-repentis TaxID=45151 RepID=A0A834RUC3_9PLEO|nr:hypothetical protein PtrM4_122020 [Pyrenophora tritici-repentis]
MRWRFSPLLALQLAGCSPVIAHVTATDAIVPCEPWKARSKRALP